MSDKSLGSLLLILSLICAVGYVFWLFYPATPGDLLFYSPWIGMRWAVVLPLLAAVLGVLFIVAWIGWTMATTPAPATEEIENLTEEK